MNSKSLVINTFRKTSSIFTINLIFKFFGFPIRILYKLIVQWLFGIDIPDTTKIGNNLTIFHGQGLVVHCQTIIGNNVTLRHNTTIGNAKPNGGCPIFGDNVDVGANSVIIGDIKIGNNSIIAAGSVVVKDVPENVLVAGNPARIIKKLDNES